MMTLTKALEILDDPRGVFADEDPATRAAVRDALIAADGFDGDCSAEMARLFAEHDSSAPASSR